MSERIDIEARKKGIGGSEVAPILGLSPWKTAYQVWEDKVGLSAGEQEETPAMAYGKLVEPVLRQWYSNRTGRTVVVPEMGVSNPKYPVLLASLDGLTQDGRVLEIKTARSMKDWGEPGSDQIPVYYMTQIQTYLLVYELKVADIVVSFAGAIPELYEVPADNEIQEMILDEAQAFWRLVETQTPPKPVSYSDMLSRFGRKSSQTTITATTAIIETLERLRVARETIALWEEREKVWKTEIMGFMAENEILSNLEGNPLVTWKMTKHSKVFDTDRFKTEQEALYVQYLKDKPGSRRMLIK